MNSTTRQFASGLIVAGLLGGAWSADAAIINNGDAVGLNYKIQGIDVAGSVDFTAHAPVAGTEMGQNNNTIGKLTLTLSHAALGWLGFSLKQNAAAAADSNAAGGLRLLLDVVDKNGMRVPWMDYHIRAVDITPNGPEDDPGGGHRTVAHFHDTTFGFGSDPLVVQGASNNRVQIDYGLGVAVNAGATFTASNILLHERDFMGLQREFRIESIPSVPEPTTFVLAAMGLLGLIAPSSDASGTLRGDWVRVRREVGDEHGLMWRAAVSVACKFCSLQFVILLAVPFDY